MKRLLLAFLFLLTVPIGLSIPSLSQAAYSPLPISPEDNASVNLETIMRNGCRRNDTNSTSSGSNGDWSTIDCDGNGRLWANTELPDAVSVTATNMTTPATAPWVLSATGCYNTTTTSMDLCVGLANVAHDAAAASVAPMLIGGYANAAAPADVSTDVDAVRAWFLRNGAQAMVLTAAGALIGGSAANGLSVDVTRVPTDPFGANADAASATGSISAKLRFIASTGIPITGTVATTISGTVAHDGVASGVNPFLVGGYANAAAPADVSNDLDAVRAWFLRNGAQAQQQTFAGVLASVGNGVSGTGVQRVTIASDSTGTLIATQTTGTNLHMVCDSGCGTGTQYTHDAALTIGTTVGTANAGRASAAVPSDVSADNDAVIAWYLRSGAQAIQQTFGGVLATTGNGASGTGVQRVTIANDSTGTMIVTQATGTNLHTVCDSGCSGTPTFTQDAALTIGTTAGPAVIGRASAAVPSDVSADNDAVLAWYLRSGAQATQQTFGGVLASTGAGNTGTGVQRVIEATDSQLSAGVGATGDSAATFGSTGSLNAKMRLLTNLTIDPCTSVAKVFVPISQTTGTQLFTGTASNRTYVCNVHVISATTQNVAFVSGTGTVCATGTHALSGGTTAGTGWNLIANEGVNVGAGYGSVMKSTTDADNVCLLMSSTGQVSGTISYVVAPN